MLSDRETGPGWRRSPGSPTATPSGPERLTWERQALGDEFTPFDVVWHARGDAVPTRTCRGSRAQGRGAGRRRCGSAWLAEARRRAAGAGALPRPRPLPPLRPLRGALLRRSSPDPKAGERRAAFGFYRDFRRPGRFSPGFTGRSARRCGAPLRLLLPDPAGLPLHLPLDRRRLAAGGAAAGAGLAVDLHARPAALPARRSTAPGRHHHADHRPLGHRQGAGGPRDRLVALHPVRCRRRARSARAGTESFFPLNLSALSPTLIESELFGHRRGAFTGAVADRAGWLEVCPPLGTVFLDEIGELEPAIQVKLLRVLETRTFQRLGETPDPPLPGQGRGRDQPRPRRRDARRPVPRRPLLPPLLGLLVTPSLRERIADSPRSCPTWSCSSPQRAVGEELADEVAREVESWIRDHLGLDYPWPGNVRELAQCVNNVLIRREYRPAGAGGAPACGSGWPRSSSPAS